MILSIDQFLRDRNDSPELHAVSLSSVCDSYTVITEEELELADEYYMEFDN